MTEITPADTRMDWPERKPDDLDARFAAFHAECAAWTPDDPPPVFYGDSMVNLKWTPPPPPCIRREASRVYRWLIVAMLAGLLAFALCNKGCDGRAGQQVKGGSNG